VSRDGKNIPFYSSPCHLLPHKDFSPFKGGMGQDRMGTGFAYHILSVYIYIYIYIYINLNLYYLIFFFFFIHIIFTI
jgi:hypothetical protein